MVVKTTLESTKNVMKSTFFGGRLSRHVRGAAEKLEIPVKVDGDGEFGVAGM